MKMAEEIKTQKTNDETAESKYQSTKVNTKIHNTVLTGAKNYNSAEETEHNTQIDTNSDFTKLNDLKTK